MKALFIKNHSNLFTELFRIIALTDNVEAIFFYFCLSLFFRCMTDIIGDIHGHADKLEELLLKLGYEKNNGVYSHSDRNVLFIGDYIDRGPKIRETLQLVKAMVDNGSAIALMGNHEYNALCFHYQESEGGHLRKHLIKNIIQHYETLKQFQNRQDEYESYLEWFTTLPLYYETDQFRAVHACWDDRSIQFLKSHLVNDRLTDNLLRLSVKRGTPLHTAVNITLKGKEMQMPEGLIFEDKDGTERTAMRIRWWEDPTKATYKGISVLSLTLLPEEPIDFTLLKNLDYYGPKEKMVFFGHYWLKGKPTPYRDNVCCLDYSVARAGHLVAYQLDDEKTVVAEKMLAV